MMHATLSAACVAFALVTFSFFSPPAQQANAARTGGADVAAGRGADQAADAQIRAALAKTLPEVKFQDLPLSQALEWLQEYLNVNMHVQWSALESSGVARDTVLNISLKNVTTERVLRLLIDELETPVSYAVQDGVLTISTRERLRRNLRTQVYDVRDLLDVIRTTPATARDAADAPALIYARLAAAGKGGGPAARSTDPTVASDPARVARLVELIMRTVDPDTWQVNGGTATIEEFNGVLVIRQFDTVHSEVRELLDSLRNALAEKK